METHFTPLPAFLGGSLIGLAAAMLVLLTGRVAGVSGIVRSLAVPPSVRAFLGSTAFLAGLVAAPFAWSALGGSLIEQAVPASTSLSTIAGLLVGFGAILGGGCTSGHGVCGLSQLSVRSLVATATFMSTAALAVYILRHVTGGWPWG